MLVEVMLCYYVFVENESKNLPLLITIRFDWKFTKQSVPVNLILMLTGLWKFYSILCST